MYFFKKKTNDVNIDFRPYNFYAFHVDHRQVMAIYLLQHIYYYNLLLLFLKFQIIYIILFFVFRTL